MSYPEHEKLAKVSEASQACGEFLDWLGSQGLQLCRLNTAIDEFEPAHEGTQALLGRFFEIDRDRLEEEKQAMIEDLRTATIEATG